MDRPTVADNKPIAVELKSGEEYHFCTCGRSSRQPFCDGTHKRFPDEQVGKEGAMGVPRTELPDWDDLQMLVAQMARKPLQEAVDVKTELVIGPEAGRPLTLSMPLFVSDMSFGALSEEAKTAMARGAELAGTGGHLPGAKNIGKIAEVRGIEAGQPAILAPTELPSPTVPCRRSVVSALVCATATIVRRASPRRNRNCGQD